MTRFINENQKEVIRRWIAAGAPAARPTETGVLPSTEALDDAPDRPALSVVTRRLGRLGAFHLLVIHFPIALLLAAAAREFWSLLEGDRMPNPVVRFCVFFGAAGAVIAAALGWLHAWNGHGAGTPEVLALHRWSGTAAAAWAISIAWFSELEVRRGARSQWFRAWLFVGCGLVAAASHFGGVLVHGENFLTGG